VKVLFLATEARPLAKVGGLADVAWELPRALRALGVSVRLALPFYPSIDRAQIAAQWVTKVEVEQATGSMLADIYQTEISNLPIYLIDGDPVSRMKSIYGDPQLEGEKFTFFSLAALKTCQVLEWKPDLIHANDWHTAPAVIWLAAKRAAQPFWKPVVSLLTIHNLRYMGAGAERAMEQYSLPASNDKRLPEWARNLPLPMGLSSADWVSTVSRSYAEEIQTPAFGCGLEGILSALRKKLTGIPNGIDMEDWDPATDAALPVRFSINDLESRNKAKRFLQEELKLEQNAAIPLLGMVTRLDWQKGIGLALDALADITQRAWQFVLLGTGDSNIDKLVCEFAAVNTASTRAVQSYDPQLARRIYAGCDLFLVPSRYEPCGLTQMIAMRYGSVPVVRSTGGLKDTVVPYQTDDGGTGFRFDSPDAKELRDTLLTAFEVYQDRREWRELQRRGMAMDFSWKHSAERYSDLYNDVCAKRLQE
jgi:starch synthase